jgi:hypothetical protein
MHAPDAPLTSTPTVGRRLAALRARLVVKIWQHGAGTILLVGALALAYAFLADWVLRVPRPLRIFHAILCLAVIGFFTWRDLLRPRRRIPGRVGLAILLERAHPELRQLLVSAVQFQGSGAAEAGAPDLVQRVLEDAEERARDLEPRRVIDDRGPRRRALLGVGAAALLALAAFANPLHSRIFLDHFLGGTSPWPQQTTLEVDLYELGEGAQIERSPELIRARVARGTDVPVVVRMHGVIPDELVVHFAESRDLVWPTGGRDVIRRLLPSLQEDLSFWVSGGDDHDGLPRIEIRVLQPPDVEDLAIRVTPPAYCGIAPSTVHGGDLEVLAGSSLRVFLLPTPPDAHGTVRILPDDLVVELEPAPFPLRPSSSEEPEGPEGTGAATGLAFDLIPTKTVGFQIELTDDSGLTNPDPGLYRIGLIEDRVPELQVLSPARTEFEVLLGGLIPLRVRAEDDFGLTSMSWTARLAGAAGLAGEETEPMAGGALPLLSLDPPDAETGGVEGASPTIETALGSTRIEVDSLGGELFGVAVNQRFEFDIRALDNREPEAGEGRALPLRMRIVTPEELMRRMQDRLGKAQLDATRLLELQIEKRRRAEDLLDAAEEDGALCAGDRLALNAAISGQRRVLGDSRALARDLAAVTEDVLYSRIDDKAGALLEFFDQRMSRVSDLSFHPEPWRELAAAHREGRLGAGGFAARLVALVEFGLAISEDHARLATEALDRAELHLETAAVSEDLVAAIEEMTASIEQIDLLLSKLEEWGNFQNILTLTRDILNRQRSLRERTEKLASDR